MVKLLPRTAVTRGASRTQQTDSKRRRRWPLYIVLVSLLSGLGFLLWQGQQQGRYPLRYIAFEGELQYLDRNDLQQRSQHFLQQNFFTLDLNAVRKLFTDEPWLEHVEVQRVWPDGLQVTLFERQVFARWGDKELLDYQGRRFAGLLPDVDLPLLQGPDGQERSLMLTYHEASQLLAIIGLKIKYLQQDVRWSWSLVLDNDIELKLGRREIRQRLQRFIDVYPTVLASYSETVAVVDLRYHNGFAVRWAVLDQDNVTVRLEFDDLVTTDA